ncbi:hypothetical protein Dsin_002629 [Dipteronia sinensis]|uniref:Uncharacterized protein n=1 Tax=Dipteronia sinensis TaxID=43782 RepID=A0AAE0B7F9_9ROSI|nr:hypothetical protein Dsin_002629 [Dipteronia sinensis]
MAMLIHLGDWYVRRVIGHVTCVTGFSIMFPFQNSSQNVNNILDDSEEDLNYEPYSDSIHNEEEGDESKDNLSLVEEEADDDNHRMDSP